MMAQLNTTLVFAAVLAFPFAASAASVDSGTTFLMHADGADATTVFSDVARNKTITAGANAQVDTAQSKFGGASALFDGTGDYLSLPGSSDWDFGSGDFTVDFWYRKSANAANGTYTRLIQLRDGDTYSGISLTDANAGNGNLVLSMSSNGSSWDIMSVDGGSVSLNTWTHIALVRSGTSIKLYVNGTATISQTSSATLTWNSAWTPVIGGQSGANRTITGWIDEMRISKGVARWTADFTPPTAPYSGGITLTGNVSFAGNLSITNALSKGSGSFVIDHPLDPENKLLYHSFVESPDVLNMYTGTAMLDESGAARVELPAYFEALNRDPQYFVRSGGEAMPNLHIKEKIKGNAFRIAGGAPGGEVSWMVTGVRKDSYILAHPIVPEVEKGPEQLVDKGEYLFPIPAHDSIFERMWSFLRSLVG